MVKLYAFPQIQFRVIANLTFEPNDNNVFITLHMTFGLLLTYNLQT